MSDRRFPWRTLLFVSVAINLVGLGALVGAYAAGVRVQREQAPEAVAERIPGARAFLAALPPELQPDIRRELGESWRATRDLRRAAAQARGEAYAAAAAEPYDVERVRSEFAELRAADQAVVGVFHDNIAGVFARLSPEQRSDVLERLRHAPPATRQGMAPESAQESAAPERTEKERQTFRERMRERRREMRERRQQ